MDVGGFLLNINGLDYRAVFEGENNYLNTLTDNIL
jgi:hypothetical protein